MTGLPMTLNASDLISAAIEEAGLKDFGADTWQEGFNVLIKSLNEEAALSEIGVSVIGNQIKQLLKNRLEIEDWFKRHPEIEGEEIFAPLFGLGLPRTGSSALSHLLSIDEARRSLRAWEAQQPCPPPEKATELTDPRIKRSQDALDMQLGLFPEISDMVPMDASGPTECVMILSLDFRSQFFESMARMPSYSAWVLQADMEPAYRYHKKVLQLLQWRCPPKSWYLKTPCHMHAIDDLNKVYPDARFVMTHRDVVRVIPSAAKLVSALSAILTDEPDPEYLGRHFADMWEEALKRLLRFRDTGQEHRFFDIAFMDMQRDAIGTVAGLYSWLGEALTPKTQTAFAEWWKANSEERYGTRRTEPELYGVSADELRDRFRFYNERFDQANPVSQ